MLRTAYNHWPLEKGTPEYKAERKKISWLIEFLEDKAEEADEQRERILASACPRCHMARSLLAIANGTCDECDWHA